MNETRARELIRQARASMNQEATDRTIAALATADEDHRTFRTILASAHWTLCDHTEPALWQAILTTHSTQVQARFNSEAEAIVWLANRLGALIWAQAFATRDYAEAVLPIPKTDRQPYAPG